MLLLNFCMWNYSCSLNNERFWSPPGVPRGTRSNLLAANTVHPDEGTFVSTTIIVQKKCYKSVKILHTELLRFLKICIFWKFLGIEHRQRELYNYKGKKRISSGITAARYVSLWLPTNTIWQRVQMMQFKLLHFTNI